MAGSISLCSLYLAKKNPVVGWWGDVFFSIELREHIVSLPNVIKFLMGSSELNIQCPIYNLTV